MVPLSQLCNADRNAQIRFAVISADENNTVCNSFETTVGQLEGGENSFNDPNGDTTLSIQNL